MGKNEEEKKKKRRLLIITIGIKEFFHLEARATITYMYFYVHFDIVIVGCGFVCVNIFELFNKK